MPETDVRRTTRSPAPNGRRRWRRRVLLSGAALGGGAALVACGGGTTSPPAPQRAKPAKVVIRNIASQPVTDLFDQRIFPAYKDRYPQYTVEAEWISSGPLVDTLAVSKSAGTDPDVYFIGGNWMPSLALTKLARDITGYVKSWNQEKDYYPGTIQTLWNRTWNIGWVSNCDLYLYRTDWFTEAGLSADPARFPVTWEAYADAVTRLTRHEGGEIVRAGVDAVNLDFREWRSLFWQTGQEEWNRDQTEAVFNNQAGVDALTFLQDVLTKRGVAPLAGMKLPGGSPNLFAAGLVAVQRVNARVANQVRTATPDVWAHADLGAPHKRARQVSHIEADGWAMSTNAREPDAGFSLLAFLQEPAQMLAYNELQGQVPPRKSLSTSAHMQQPFLKTYAAAIDKYGHPYRLDVNHPGILKPMIDDVMSGKKGVKQSLDDAVAEINRAFAQLPPPPK
jgi:multiple sugar transport system substrate-binding protein